MRKVYLSVSLSLSLSLSHAMAAAARQCPICVKDVKAKDMVSCPACTHSACRTCVKRFLLTVTDASLKCMEPTCGAAWSTDFVAGAISRAWLNTEHRDHICAVLVDGQERYMTGTHKYVAWKEQLRSAAQQIEALKRKRDDAAQQIEGLKRQRYQIGQDILDKNGFIRSMAQRMKVYDEGGRANAHAYHHPCVCCDKGVMSAELEEETMACSACRALACMHCHAAIPSLSGHVCDAEAKDSVANIKATCKQCPSCHTYTHKIDGCSQIWCSKCHTFWDYNTSQIDTHGLYHNPVYVAYLNANAEARRANELGRMRDYEKEQGFAAAHFERGPRQLVLEVSFDEIRELQSAPVETVKLLKAHYYYAAHKATEANRLETDATRLADPELSARELRLQVLEGELTRSEFGRALLQINQRLAQVTAVQAAFERYIQEVNGIFVEVVSTDTLECANAAVVRLTAAHDELNRARPRRDVKKDDTIAELVQFVNP